jgi:hypothetical protein
MASDDISKILLNRAIAAAIHKRGMNQRTPSASTGEFFNTICQKEASKILCKCATPTAALPMPMPHAETKVGAD